LSDLRLLWECATSDGVPRRSIWVMVVVGTLLNLINQGDALLGGGGVDWLKLALTYVVPYCVATYGAATARVAAMRVDAAAERPR